MVLLIKNFKESFQLLKKDKGLMVLSLVPIVFGILLYSLFGKFIYVDFLSYLNASLEGWFESEYWFKAISVVLTLLLSVIFYFLVSWTFISIVGLFASPFNDLMAARVERIYLGEKTDEAQESWKRLLGRLFFTLYNELKKVIFIMSLTLVGVLLSFLIPPIGIFVSAVLVAISFVDYSWGQHDLGVRACVKNYKSSFWSYTISGLFFLFWVSIPILNLLALPFGVIYFALLNVRKTQQQLRP